MNERIFHDDIEKLRRPERIERCEIERVIDLSLEGIGTGSVLDVGTGTALFAEHFVKRGCKVCGIDINPKMMEAAERYVPQGEFKISKAEAIPYPDGYFDVVFFGNVLHEVDDYLKALKEARRVCRKRVSILEWPYKQEESGPPIEHRLKPEKVISLAKRAGFSKIEKMQLTVLILYRLEI
jgi:ubiquinone/menaquinone biosynthesis C-methylase UbiE